MMLLLRPPIVGVKLMLLFIATRRRRGKSEPSWEGDPNVRVAV